MQQAGPGRPRARGPEPAPSFLGKIWGSVKAGTATSIVPKQGEGGTMSQPRGGQPWYPTTQVSQGVGWWQRTRIAQSWGGARAARTGLARLAPALRAVPKEQPRPGERHRLPLTGKTSRHRYPNPFLKRGGGQGAARPEHPAPHCPPPGSLPGSGGLFLSIRCSRSCKAASCTLLWL